MNLPERMRAISAIALLVVLPAGMSARADDKAAAAADVAVVCPDPLFEAFRPWLDYRTGQGHRVALIRDVSSRETIRRQIRDIARGGRLRFVVLVGDVDAGGPAVPTYLARAKVNVHWGSSPEIATDNGYADLDDDNVPDVAVGRLSVDNAAELTAVVRKTLTYERSPATGLWRRRVHFVAGVGNFGILADSVIETAAKKFIVDGIPPAYRTTMAYGNWRSPFCPDPRDFRTIAQRRLNDGSLFWVYIGHGHPQRLDRVNVPGGSFPIFESDDVEALRCREGHPVAVFLACSTGAFDRPADCLAETMLRSEGGPVAVVAGSRVTMPYAMAVLGDGLLDAFFRRNVGTVGEVLLHAKRAMTAEVADNPNRRLLDALAKAISPKPDQLPEERAEHVLLFNLLGDPMLRLRRPRSVAVKVPRYATSGEPLKVSIETDLAGSCVVELACRRDRFTFAPPRRHAFDPSHEAMASLTGVFDKANDGRWTSTTLAISQRAVQTTLAVPSDARGSSHVRVFIQGESRCAVGAAEVYIRPPANTDTQSGKN